MPEEGAEIDSEDDCTREEVEEDRQHGEDPLEAAARRFRELAPDREERAIHGPGGLTGRDHAQLGNAEPGDAGERLRERLLPRELARGSEEALLDVRRAGGARREAEPLPDAAAGAHEEPQEGERLAERLPAEEAAEERHAVGQRAELRPERVDEPREE